MKKYPHVIFSLNKELDKEMIKEFLEYPKKAGMDFAAEIWEIHPKLKEYYGLKPEEQKALINDYTDSYYIDHSEDLEKAKKSFQKKWDKVEDNFYMETDKVFNNLFWPEGKYRGFISIITSGPRFLETKEFQSFYGWEENIIGQAVHEMLHFQFYNQLSFLKDTITVDEDGIWQLSEIFNDIVQAEPGFVKIQGYTPKVSYPEHRELVEKYKKSWDRAQNVSQFILKSINKK